MESTPNKTWFPSPARPCTRHEFQDQEVDPFKCPMAAEDGPLIGCIDHSQNEA